MLTTYSDEGVVLRRIDYGEADRILTVFTRQHGKLGVIARGVRKPRSRLGAYTDLFTRSRMQLAHGRGELEVLTQAELLSPVFTGGELARTAYAAVCAELTDRAFEPHHPDDAAYQLVAAGLDGCIQPGRDPRAAFVWFARRIIDRLGYGPELVNCVSCGTRLAETEACFSAVAGGLLCGLCAPGDPGSIVCPVRVIKVLRIIAAGDEALFARLRLDGASLACLEAIIELELAQHLDRRLRSMNVLRCLIQV